MLIYTMPLLGGALIGIAVSLMLYLNGRITGVSGIVSRALIRKPGDTAWRLAFVVGLLVGGVILRIVLPETLNSSLDRSVPALIVAGLLVGYGTVMGSGCTSGHGICGLSRLSPRSLVATLVFIGAGIASATIFRLLLGAP